MFKIDSNAPRVRRIVKWFGLIAAAIVIFIMLPTLAAMQSNSSSNELFRLVGSLNNNSTVSIAAVRDQSIEINLDDINFDSVRELTVPLLDGKTYKAVRTEAEGFVRQAADGFTWRGKIMAENNWRGDIILTVKGKAMSGLIYTPTNVYEIIPQANFAHLLVEIDQSRFPAEIETEPPAPRPSVGTIKKNILETIAPGESGLAKSIFSNDSGSEYSEESLVDDGSLIDVMIVYTAQVRTFLGGTTQAEAFAQQSIASTNTAYQNSGITTRLRLVQAMEVSYNESAGTLAAALPWVAGDATVAAARNTAKADMVAIIVQNASDGCGLAYVMRTVGASFASSAFSSVSRFCAVGNLSFAHELGHNQGFEHNPENGGPSGSASYPYAFGHYVNGSFRTVMSYVDPCPSGCNRVPYFSNPAVTYNGAATGIANTRDNHRVLNNTALTISRFRDSGGGGGGCTASAISFGQTVNGSLVTTDCAYSGSTRYVDLYTFSGTAGQQIAISMSSTFDTYLYLLNSSGTTIAGDNNGGGGTNSRIPATSGFFTLPASGTYTIQATSFSADTTGSYTLSLIASAGCSYSLNSTGQSFPAAAGNGSVGVTSGTGCAWTAASNAPSWITVNSGIPGSGNGTVGFSVLANSSTSSRTGTITAAGQTFTISQAGQPVIATRKRFDFDGDGRADIAVYRPSVGAWHLLRSQAGYTGFGFGIPSDMIVPADYDNDGKTDVGVWRNGAWYWINSQSNTFQAASFGQAGDIPAPADFDGDGRADFVVFRPANGTWYLQRTQLGFTATQFGQSGDVPVAGDYDADGKADIAVWRPGNGAWYLLRSRDGFTGVGFGQNGDIPAPADFDGDNKADVAVFRSGAWYRINTQSNTFEATGFGTSGDKPISAAFVP